MCRRTVFLLESADENVVLVVEELQRRLIIVHTNQGLPQDNTIQHYLLQDMESPFEFQALEVVLEAICSFLAARTTELEMDTYPALDELTNKVGMTNTPPIPAPVPNLIEKTALIYFGFFLLKKFEYKMDGRNLDKVRRQKNTVTGLIARSQKAKDELEQLMDNDDEMADLYLTRKSSSRSSSSGRPAIIESEISRATETRNLGEENDVEELEMLLEAYFMHIDDTLNRLTKLRVYMDDTEDYINIQIDNHRNQLIQLELFLSSADISLAFYALVCGIFGMSIPFSWNQGHDHMFKWLWETVLVNEADDSIARTCKVGYVIWYGWIVMKAHTDKAEGSLSESY
ncbi:hypothetical protein VNO78_22316 [Psophocarpus tetragonolobus]|uniref:Magnesium transporter n=1 Tax=Psophocarpus tetragonolobus TaxID=3891 RepID=A0AAN9SD78_PSOTE